MEKKLNNLHYSDDTSEILDKFDKLTANSQSSTIKTQWLKTNAKNETWALIQALTQRTKCCFIVMSSDCHDHSLSFITTDQLHVLQSINIIENSLHFTILY